MDITCIMMIFVGGRLKNTVSPYTSTPEPIRDCIFYLKGHKNEDQSKTYFRNSSSTLHTNNKMKNLSLIYSQKQVVFSNMYEQFFLQSGGVVHVRSL